jgi:hypothetical protein
VPFGYAWWPGLRGIARSDEEAQEMAERAMRHQDLQRPPRRRVFGGRWFLVLAAALVALILVQGLLLD